MTLFVRWTVPGEIEIRKFFRTGKSQNIDFTKKHVKMELRLKQLIAEPNIFGVTSLREYYWIATRNWNCPVFRNPVNRLKSFLVVFQLFLIFITT